MTKTATSLKAFLDAHPAAAKVEVSAAKGSTPREAGTWMLVAPERIFGTIGGGQLEFMAIDEARALLRAAPAAEAEREKALDIPLGPEIGQCCGGRVGLSIERVDQGLRDRLLARARAEDDRLPRVLVFGGGHVGRALADALVLLPVRATVVETRAEAIAGFPADVETRLSAVPEELVRAASAGTAFVVLTHDHALDFLIVSEALKRGDAAYVGMIGSATKKATFRSWFLKTAGGSAAALSRLVTPIGGDGVRDKRPAVIAALAAAEIMTALVAAFQPSSSASR
ncbi:xanthine dehydrogenase accessory protein XdhC [Nitratireductor sp. StC3]|uniref:xanthine dehydrogenase accessory protein XdhC n=1 Tax=Nitratireductor sp. StC3 TaxID=2126741 RepID=UPI000D0D127E|nr:xanthine dehydrogenase accessory protein XdhC [Nitratireductor sp. StC3]PSM17550.1 xanthine dehydrogenase accessory protein XdhC [Nitratireductor sp. StC3]